MQSQPKHRRTAPIPQTTRPHCRGTRGWEQGGGCFAYTCISPVLFYKIHLVLSAFESKPKLGRKRVVDPSCCQDVLDSTHSWFADNYTTLESQFVESLGKRSMPGTPYPMTLTMFLHCACRILVMYPPPGGIPDSIPITSPPDTPHPRLLLKWPPA